MSGDSKKMIAFSYLGSKFSIVDKIEPLFPEHIHFIDVFMGSMAVTLNKKRSQIETVNDINGDVVNFFRVLRERPYELYTQLFLTPISREEFNNSWEMENITEMERARRFYVRIRQSFYSMGAQKQSKGWHLVKTQSRSNMAETISKWRNSIDKLFPVIDRLTSVQIENRHFRDLIPVLDFKDAFFYEDPPYPLEVRKSSNDYKFEFTDQDHEELAEINHSCKGKVMISSYDGPMMQSLYKDWYFIKLPVKLNNIRKSPVQECVWMNYDPNQINGRLSIFDLYSRQNETVSII